MSAEEFWRDDPQLFVSYRTFYIEKQKKEMEETDYKCWLLGEYIHQGNGNLVANLIRFLGNMVSKKKNMGNIPEYPKKPFLQMKKEQNIEKPNFKENKNEKYDDYENSLVYLSSMKKRYRESVIDKNKKKGE